MDMDREGVENNTTGTIEFFNVDGPWPAGGWNGHGGTGTGGRANELHADGGVRSPVRLCECAIKGADGA
jgi:hypothetical protein